MSGEFLVLILVPQSPPSRPPATCCCWPPSAFSAAISEPVCWVISAATLRAVRLPAAMKKCEPKAAPREKPQHGWFFSFCRLRSHFFPPHLHSPLIARVNITDFYFLFLLFITELFISDFPHHAEEALLVCAFFVNKFLFSQFQM